MQKQKNKQRGITLISLVVTIIVLIILAGVSINMIVGENGIITQAKKAEEQTRDATVQSEKQMNSLVYEMEGNLSKVNVNEIAIQNCTIDGKTANYLNPVIPKGFKAINTETAKWGETDAYLNGLVIEDATSDSVTQGSQFVWIPVKNYEEFHLIEGYDNKKLQNRLTQPTPSREAGMSLTENLPKEPNNAKNALLGTIESVSMYESVRKYGGFYIARYEAGVEGTTTSTITEDANKQVQNGTIKPVSKKGVGVWNCIAWGDNSADLASDGVAGNDLEDGAVRVARAMYNNPITGDVNTETTVVSTLCYGVQWDAIMNFLDSGYITASCDINSIIVNSQGIGNATGKIATTGSSESYKQKNIYDLAGNLYEWTMEAFGDNMRIRRGGHYDSDFTTLSISNRATHEPDGKGPHVGFRVALYIP